MMTAYNIGDNILLKGTVIRIEVVNDHILYHVREYDRPIQEEDVVCRIASAWKLGKKND